MVRIDEDMEAKFSSDKGETRKFFFFFFFFFCNLFAYFTHTVTYIHSILTHSNTQ